ncbi:MAG: glutamate-5-semialdehyde dehydrogenase [Clostridia bacterium]|nr:glutamate-5-semialdehyde dehydrogenase [Clostridia bacterium]
MTTIEILKACSSAKRSIAALSTECKNAALNAVADSLEACTAEILAANAEDMREACSSVSSVMLDRLALDEKRIKAMADGVRQVAKLPDPVGVTLDEITRADGLKIKKISVPLGVVAIIYESRPNVTSDAAALALKSGNACVLRTGREAHRSAEAIVNAMRKGLAAVGIDGAAIGFIEDVSRDSALELMRAKGYIDLLIPRGGAGLIRACVDNAKVPCIETGTGICHVYVDGKADLEKALKIVENAKCSRPSVCNAMEVCLVDKVVAREFLPMLWEKLAYAREENPVQLILDKEAYSVLGGKQNCCAAEADDFDTEFLDYKMAVAVVDGVEGAIAHVSAHSTGHSDCIITEDGAAAEKFVSSVDSAAVYVNASTRFTDGGEFGLGCEMGISTQKLHARGPMGLKELTTYKYVISGNGNVR